MERFLYIKILMKSVLLSILIISLISSPYHFVRAAQGMPLEQATQSEASKPSDQSEQVPLSELDQRTANRAFLLDLRDRIDDFMHINKVHLENIEKCFEQKETQVSQILSLPNSQVTECEQVKRAIRNNIAIQYPKMRKALLLMSLLDSSFVSQLFTQFLKHQNQLATTGRSDVEIPIDSNIQSNPLVTNKWAGMILPSSFHLPDPDFSTQEIETALGGVGDKLQFQQDKKLQSETPNELAQHDQLIEFNLNSLMQYFCTQAFEANKEGCKTIQILYNPQHRTLFFKTIAPSKEWVSQYFIHLKLQFESRSNSYWSTAHNQAEKSYYSYVSLNPYVALVSHAYPGNNEIKNAFYIMLINAQDALKKFELELFMRLKRPDVSEKELRTLLSYNVIANDVLNNPGMNMQLLDLDFKSTFEYLTSAYARDSYVKLGMELTEIIVGNVLVCYGFGWATRAFKGAALVARAQSATRLRDLLNPLCFSMSGAAINSYFVYDSFEEYKQTYLQLFSSPQGANILREVHELDSARKSIFWTVLLAPVGVGLTSGVKYVWTRTFQSLKKYGIILAP
ncbi:MAG: hypothetical protein ABL927_10615 [Bdellovibrionales bacterium]